MSTVERQPRGMFQRRQAPVGDLAQEWGERHDLTRSIGRGGKPTESAPAPNEGDKNSAVYEALNALGGDADWQEIARRVQAEFGFVLTEVEITPLRERWKSLGETEVVRRAPQEQEMISEAPDLDPPSEIHHGPDK